MEEREKESRCGEAGTLKLWPVYDDNQQVYGGMVKIANGGRASVFGEKVYPNVVLSKADLQGHLDDFDGDFNVGYGNGKNLAIQADKAAIRTLIDGMESSEFEDGAPISVPLAGGTSGRIIFGGAGRD